MANELSAQQVETLLDKLGNDDAFRAALEKDPAAALQSIGLPAELAACVSSGALPAKATAKAAAATLRAGTQMTLAQNVHNLVAR